MQDRAGSSKQWLLVSRCPSQDNPQDTYGSLVLDDLVIAVSEDRRAGSARVRIAEVAHLAGAAGAAALIPDAVGAVTEESPATSSPTNILS